MAPGRSLSEILDECLGRIANGESVDVCVADYPEYAIELRDDLEAAVMFRGAFGFRPSDGGKRAARIRMIEALEKKQSRGFSIPFSFPRSWFSTGTRIAATAAVAVVALVTSGTGTVLASQSSTPGDVLYPVKRAGEQVQLAFAFSDSREAALRESLTAKRMDELDQVTAAGREEFVPDLVDEIIEHSTRARALASAPVEDIVDTLPAIDALPTLEPAGTGSENVTPIGTPVATPTPLPVGRADKQVSVTPVLALAGELEDLDERLRKIESDVLQETSRAELAKLRKSLNQTKQQLNSLMNRADQVHNPDVVERPVDQDKVLDGGLTPTATPTAVPDEALGLTLGGRVTGIIQDVIFQQEGGKLVRVDALLTLDSDDSLLLVQFTRGGTRLLKDGRGASVQLLRIGQQVVLSVDGSGEVHAMSILDTPRQSDSDDGGGRAQGSENSNDHSRGTAATAAAPGRGAQANAGR